MTMIYDQKIQMIAAHYGEMSQLKKTLEELDELAVEVRRMINVKENSEPTTVREHRMADEIADVRVMTDQLIYLFNLKEYVDDRIRYKLARQETRIKEETKA